MSTTTHWTDDAELLGHYVLGRVPAAERAALEEHLQACAQCRAAVKGERLIAAGVRRAGREGLRNRLTSRTAGRVSSPRYRILAAAAIAVIAGGIALLGRWASVQEETPRIAQETQLASPPSESLHAEAQVAPVPEKPVRRSPASRERPRPASLPGADSGEHRRAMAAKAGSVPQEMGIAEETHPNVIWWSGVLTNAPVSEDVEMEDAGIEAAGEAVRAAPPAAGPVLVLHQQLTGEIAGRAKQAAALPQDFPARVSVERRGDTLQITLHIPRLLPPEWLRHPVITGVAEDSLSLLIGGALLRVRVPEGTSAYGFPR